MFGGELGEGQGEHQRNPENKEGEVIVSKTHPTHSVSSQQGN